MPRMKETVTIKDPKALRALAHPARQKLVTELFSGRVLTATEAAEMVGLSPSAVSHHLRALEKYGLAQRAKATGDGRERPWKGTGRTLNLQPSGIAGSVPALQSILAVQMDELTHQLDTFIKTRTDDPWAGSYQGLARGELSLTRAETEELRDTVMAAIDKFTHRQLGRKHAQEVRRTAFTWSLLPIEPAPVEPAPIKPPTTRGAHGRSRRRTARTPEA